MIQLKELTKIYNPNQHKAVHALTNINLTFQPGEFVCIYGKSGSGKSTLLNLLSGLDFPTSGAVYLGKQDMKQFNETELANCRKDDIGFIFQDFQLLDHLTVMENIELGLSMSKYDKNTKHQKILDVLKQVELTDYSHHKTNELSGGQKQRVSIARALIKNPSVLIADEPTGALDSMTSSKIMGLLQKVAESGKLVLVVTHDHDFKGYATRLITLKDGKVISDELQSEPNNQLPPKTTSPPSRAFNFMSAFNLSARNIYKKKWRYFLVSIGMIIGLCGLSVALGMSNGISSYVQYARDNMINSQKLTFIKDDLLNNDDYFNLQKQEAVDFIQKEFVLQGKIKGNWEEINFNMKPLIKADHSTDYTQPQPLYGQLPEKDDEIALSEEIARKLLPSGSSLEEILGRELDIKALAVDDINYYPSRWDNQKYTVSAVIEKSLIDQDYAYITYDSHSNIARRSRFLGKNQDIPSNYMSVYVKDSKDIVTVYNQFKEQYTIIQPSDHLSGIISILRNFNILVMLGAVLILVIASLMIGIILYISVLERQKEIGLIIALGGTKLDIKKIFMSEGILLGAFASICGVCLSLILQIIVTPIIMTYANFLIYQPTAFTCLTSIGIGLCISFLSSVIPAHKASKFSPMELLRRH